MNDRKSIIGILVCVLFYLAYTYYLQKKYPDFGKPSIPDTSVTTAESPATPKLEDPSGTPKPETIVGSPAETVAGVTIRPEESFIENNVMRIEFNAQGQLAKIILKKFKDGPLKKSAAVNLADQPLKLLVTTTADFKGADQLLAVTRKSPTEMLLVSRDGDWEKSMTVSLPDQGYAAGIEINTANKSGAVKNLVMGLNMVQEYPVEKTSSGLLPSGHLLKKNLIVGTEGSRSGESLDSYCQDDAIKPIFRNENIDVDFAGVDFHYFLAVMLPAQPKQNVEISKLKPAAPGQLCEISSTVWQDQGNVQPNESIAGKFQLYLGPKEVDTLEATSTKLRETVDFGWFGLIGRPLLIAIKSLEAHLTHNYGLAIILLTILLKIAFYPLTRSAALSMKRMQLFTPEINRIKEKFKDDRQAQQREMMQFMSKHKINPAKGCLPILPQIPVFIAFYNVLSQAIELRHAPFYGWIRDLSASDPMYITPLLLGAGMVLQQKLTPNPTMDKTQEKIMMIVPFMFTFMMLTLPAGMVLYMLTNTVVSIAQQQWISRRLNIQGPPTDVSVGAS